MSLYADNLRYSLAKRVPDMERGFSIHTNYGEIEIDPDQAAPIIKAVQAALNQELKSCPKENNNG